MVKSQDEGKVPTVATRFQRVASIPRVGSAGDGEQTRLICDYVAHVEDARHVTCKPRWSHGAARRHDAASR